MPEPVFDHPTSSEISIISEMLAYAQDILKIKDANLCRWLIFQYCMARNFQVAPVKIMLQQLSLFSTNVQKSLIEKSSTFADQFQDINNHMEFGLHFVDNLGNPVAVARPAGCRWKDLFRKYDVQTIVNYHIFIFERWQKLVLPVASATQNKRIDQIIYIIDCSDLDIFYFLSGKPAQFVKETMAICQNFYPNLVRKFFVINVPRLFNILWIILKHFVHENTIKKITITPNMATERLLAEIPANNLLEIYGGKSQGKLTDNLGPWKKEFDLSFVRNSFYISDNDVFRKYYWTFEEKQEWLKQQITKVKTIQPNFLKEVNIDAKPLCLRKYCLITFINIEK